MAVNSIANSDDSIPSIYILVPNMLDSELKPIKSTLAKQLQEIVPINMIITAEQIIGIADDNE